MSNRLFMAMLVPKKGFTQRMLRLLNPALDSTHYPDCFIPTWKSCFITNTASLWDSAYLQEIDPTDFQNRCLTIEQAQNTPFAETPKVSMHVGNWDHVYGSCTSEQWISYQDVILSVCPDNDGVYDSKYVLLHASPTLRTYGSVPHNFESLFVLQKLVELLEPTYAWSSSQIDRDDLWAKKELILEPWKDYTYTKFFSYPLLEQLGLADYDWKANQDLYRVDILKSGIWLANRLGLGNESPDAVDIYFEVCTGSQATENVQVVDILLYEDWYALRDATNSSHDAAMAKLVGMKNYG
jgi:hypothetical protein